MADIYTTFETRHGWMGVVSSAEGIKAVLLPQPTRDAVEREISISYPMAHRDADPLRDIQERLLRFLDGEAVMFDDPVDMTEATEFRRDAWQAARRIPRGAVQTYAQLAATLGRPKAARAVGGAMASNPVPIIVPCHRVVGSDGSLTGYAGGLRLKETLLAGEGRAVQQRLDNA